MRAVVGVPALKLREVLAVGVGHRRAEVVARDRLPVVPLKVQVHALSEAGRAAAKTGFVRASLSGHASKGRGQGQSAKIWVELSLKGAHSSVRYMRTTSAPFEYTVTV